jgi:O-methyltransferase involved in polyketide biosynthesis
VDTSRPNIARVYDFFLGGTNNFPADRELAANLLELDASIPRMVRDNRAFLTSAAARAALEGVEQVLDLGAGLPTHPSVHEAVRTVNPGARVAYVDNDTAVVRHTRALIAGSQGLSVAESDLTDPDAVLGDPEVTALLDFARPVCVIIAGVLYFLDAASAREIVSGYVNRLAPGSWLAVSVARLDDEERAEAGSPVYTAATYHDHSPADLAEWFEGLDIVPPGIAEARRWISGTGGTRGDGLVYPLCIVGIKR